LRVWAAGILRYSERLERKDESEEKYGSYTHGIITSAAGNVGKLGELGK
jgi:hypothetical protein